MSITAAPPGLQPEDFDKIEDVLAETARGRMFLGEFARRTKEAERARILEEIDRLQDEEYRMPVSVPANAADATAGLLDLAWSCARTAGSTTLFAIRSRRWRAHSKG
jgi:hypothetical protein